jgi:hypothetical protein
MCSAGWVTLLLAAFVAIIEWASWKRWAFPFVVVGLNPITLYCMWQLMNPFVRDNLKRHIDPQVFESLGAIYAPILERVLVLRYLAGLLLMYRGRSPAGIVK